MIDNNLLSCVRSWQSKICFLLIFVVWLLPICPLSAQEKIDQKGQQYVLIHEVVVQEINFLTKAIDTTPVVLFDDVVFNQMQEIENGTSILIKAIQNVKKKKNPKITSSNPFPLVEIGKYYVVEKNRLKDNRILFTPKTWELRAGVVNVPVKFYLPADGEPLDFSSKSVSLGTTIGVARQTSNTKRNLWLNYLLGAQFTMVTPTTDDFLSFDQTSGDGNTLSAFSLSLGFGIDFEGIEVSFFLGKDFLPGSASKDWKHNGDTWFSIGVGTSLSGGN